MCAIKEFFNQRTRAEFILIDVRSNRSTDPVIVPNSESKSPRHIRVKQETRAGAFRVRLLLFCGMQPVIDMALHCNPRKHADRVPFMLEQSFGFTNNSESRLVDDSLGSYHGLESV